jgi:polyhydroxybutyrate depolymerase
VAYWLEPSFPLDPQLDIDFLTELIDALESRYVIDPAMIYVGGHSSGACMTHLIGAVLSDRIAAIGSVAGTVAATNHGVYVEAPAPQFPVSAVTFHGFLDDNVPFDGGEGIRPGYNWVSESYSTGWWVNADGCDPTPGVWTSDDGNIVQLTFSGGADSTEVRLYVIEDGGHPYPQPPTLSTTDEIWSFFAAHPKVLPVLGAWDSRHPSPENR